MRTIVVLLLAVLAAAPALAQEAKTLKTVKIQEPAPDRANLYAIDKDGTVRIDWDAVEVLASSQLDPTFRPRRFSCWRFATEPGNRSAKLFSRASRL